MQIVFTGILYGHYKGLPSFNNIFTCTCCLFVSFHRTLFRGLAGACMNPGSFSLFVHSLVCPITHSYLDGFQPNLVQHSFHVCSTCHTVFSLKNTLECICERLLHYRLIFSITWTPDKSFAQAVRFSCILKYHAVASEIKKNAGLSFSKLSFKVAFAYMLL